MSRRKNLLERMNSEEQAVALKRNINAVRMKSSMEADLAARIDRLKKAGPGMTFEERGAQDENLWRIRKPTKIW